nr:MAG TPA_asm: hypothetical protein [Caudoviricetes sp.]
MRVPETAAVTTPRNLAKINQKIDKTAANCGII